MISPLLPYERDALDEDEYAHPFLVVIKTDGPDDADDPHHPAVVSIIWTNLSHAPSDAALPDTTRLWAPWLNGHGYQLGEGISLHAQDTAGRPCRVLRASLIPLHRA